MKLFTKYISNPGTTIHLDATGAVIQNGRGLVFYETDTDDHFHFILNGTPFQAQFNGCNLVKDSIYRVIIGVDHAGKPWRLWVDHDNLSKKEARTWEYGSLNNIRLTAEKTRELFEGRSFPEAIAEFIEEERKRELDLLRQKAGRAESLEQCLAAIYTVNQKAGPGSRKEVGEMISNILPGISG